MTRTCSFWTVSPRLPDDLRQRSSARDHAGPVSHNHKKRTRGALTASLFVVPPGPCRPGGFCFPIPTYLAFTGVVPGVIHRKQHPTRQQHPMRARAPSRRPIAAAGCPARHVGYPSDMLHGLWATTSPIRVIGVGDRFGLGSVALATASAVDKPLGPAAGHRHTILTIATLIMLDGCRRLRGYFRSRGAPTGTRSRPRPGSAAPAEHDDGSRRYRLAVLLQRRRETFARYHEDTAQTAAAPAAGRGVDLAKLGASLLAVGAPANPATHRVTSSAPGCLAHAKREAPDDVPTPLPTVRILFLIFY